MLRSRAAGFTLIELMVVVSVGALLLTLALPQWSGLVASARIRTAAEAYASGLTQARAESIKQNTSSEFLLSAGKWVVRRISDNTILHQGAGLEGSAVVVVTPAPANATRVAFDSLGRIVSPSLVDGSSAITQMDFDVSNGATLGSKRRALRVLLETGGAVKICDPLLASTDVRACV